MEYSEENTFYVSSQNNFYASSQNNSNYFLEATLSLTSMNNSLWTQSAQVSSFCHPLFNSLTNYPHPNFQPNVSFASDANDVHIGRVSELSPLENKTSSIQELLHVDQVVVDCNDKTLNLNTSYAMKLTSNDSLEEDSQNKNNTNWVRAQWTKEEDWKLNELVKQHGCAKWATIARHMEGRNGKQCRERWHNHLRPNIKKNIFWTEEEERLMVEAHKKIGNKWAEIAKLIPGRTQNAVKNHWNATIRKQTSKRKLKSVAERMNGIIPPTILEDYIKAKYFNKGSTLDTCDDDIHHSTTCVASENHLAQNNSTMIVNLAGSTLDYDDDGDSNNDEGDSTGYFLAETLDEEMYFMKTLFEDGKNFKGKSTSSATNEDGNSTSNLATSIVENARGDHRFYPLEPNMEEIGVTI